jgi:hypothetical protein
MDLRISLQHTLLTLIGVLCLPISALALPPFDITDTTTRTVVIWFDDNSTDPSSVGNDLKFAFNGIWTSDGTTGTIVVDRVDVLNLFPSTGIAGTPVDTENWSDQTTTIDIATGDITSMTQTGTLTIDIIGDQTFSYDLNTKYIDHTVASNPYEDTGFGGRGFGNDEFTAWCTDINPGQLSFNCPPYGGPTPFAYNSSTGRFNAIGPIKLGIFLHIYATFGDAQLFEESDPVPALSDPMFAVLVLALLVIGTKCIPREAGVV